MKKIRKTGLVSLLLMVIASMLFMPACAGGTAPSGQETSPGIQPSEPASEVFHWRMQNYGEAAAWY